MIHDCVDNSRIHFAASIANYSYSEAMDPGFIEFEDPSPLMAGGREKYFLIRLPKDVSLHERIIQTFPK
jgi:hypothetical protein